MSTKERIMTIRLMKKLQTHPSYAKALGIEICVGQQSETDDKKA